MRAKEYHHRAGPGTYRRDDSIGALSRSIMAGRASSMVGQLRPDTAGHQRRGGLVVFRHVRIIPGLASQHDQPATSVLLSPPTRGASAAASSERATISSNAARKLAACARKPIDGGPTRKPT